MMHYESLGSSLLWQILTLYFFFFFMTDSFEEIWLGILLNVPQLPFVWYFSQYRTGVIIFGKKTTKVKCSFHHTTSPVHTINMTYHYQCGPWSLWAEIVFVSVLYCEIPLLLFLPTQLLGKKSPYAACTQGVRS